MYDGNCKNIYIRIFRIFRIYSWECLQKRLKQIKTIKTIYTYKLFESVSKYYEPYRVMSIPSLIRQVTLFETLVSFI